MRAKITPEMTGWLTIRCARDLQPALKRASRSRKIGVSAYVRQALIDRLAADGVVPLPSSRANLQCNVGSVRSAL